jgi:RNA-binding protein PNO1
VTFAGIDEKMELTKEENDTLMEFETVQTKGKPEDNTIEFDKVKVEDLGVKRDEYRRVPVPRNRVTPLKQQWDSILKTLVEHMKLQVRMNTKKRCIELKVSKKRTYKRLDQCPHNRYWSYLEGS